VGGARQGVDEVPGRALRQQHEEQGEQVERELLHVQAPPGHFKTEAWRDHSHLKREV
jgi:uncharacterized protein (UPF0218 family)